jgi:hypothetical protein
VKESEMKTFEYHPITDSKQIGVAPDGSKLRSWAEGPRTFVETYVYFKATSGTTYGVIEVVETTVE